MPAAGSASAPTVGELLGPGGLLARVIGAGYEARGAQLAMAEAVAQTLAVGRPLVVEAGTGTGKSLAYLAGGLAAGARVVVATSSKALQGQLLHHDLPLLARALGGSPERGSPDRGLRYGAAKGKANYLCLWRAAGRYGSWAWPAGIPPLPMTAWAESTATGDLAEVDFPTEAGSLAGVAAGDDCLGPSCRHYHDCWYYQARRAWPQAQVLVANHALLLTELTRPLGLLDAPPASAGAPAPTLLVCDEAHQLESYAVAAKSTDVTWRSLRHAVRLDARLDPLVADFFAEAADWAAPGEDSVIAAEEHLATGLDLVLGLRGLAGEFWSGREPPSNLADAPRYAEAVRLRHLAERVKAVSEPTAPGFVRHVAQTFGSDGHTTPGAPESLTVANTAYQVAGLLAQLPALADGIVYCSATLATGRGAGSLAYFERSVGLAAGAARELVVGSPFDYARQGRLYLPAAGRLPADPNDPAYAAAAGRELAELARLAGGRTLGLFTAYSNLRAAAREVARLAPELTVLVQGESVARDALIAQFRQARGRGHVLLGAKSFWEGVSLEGDQLAVVVVERVPFTPPGPVQLARQAELTARGGQWFRDLALPEAIGVLRQGVGRLIRTTADRGVVALLDPRLTAKTWGRAVLSALPPFTPTRDLAAVARFLAGQKDAS